MARPAPGPSQANASSACRATSVSTRQFGLLLLQGDRADGRLGDIPQPRTSLWELLSFSWLGRSQRKPGCLRCELALRDQIMRALQALEVPRQVFYFLNGLFLVVAYFLFMTDVFTNVLWKSKLDSSVQVWNTDVFLLPWQIWKHAHDEGTCKWVQGAELSAARRLSWIKIELHRRRLCMCMYHQYKHKQEKVLFCVFGCSRGLK